MRSNIVVAYVPALHAGYKKFFQNQDNAQTLYIIGQDIIASFRPLQKDVRALDPLSVKQAITGWKLFDSIEIIDLEKLKALNSKNYKIVMPNEDISHELAHNYLTDTEVGFSPIFLRWDRKSSNAKDQVAADITISKAAFDKAAMKNAYRESEKSSDIWRRVGAILVKDGKPIAIAHNQSTPTHHSAAITGDPRNNYTKGVEIEKSVFIHAEAKLIATAAKSGTPLEGADMYVTTFPCPGCAKLIAFSGIKRLFFNEGYTMLDGANLLKAHGIQLIKVDAAPPKSDSNALLYPEK